MDTKYLGQQQLINPKTGEALDCDVLIREHKDMKRGWNRVYLGAFMDLLIDISSSKAVKIVEFLLDNLNSDHQFVYSIQQTADKVGISYKTAQVTFSELKKANFLRQEGRVYIVNPEFVGTFGTDKKNKSILIRFSKAEPNLFTNASAEHVNQKVVNS